MLPAQHRLQKTTDIQQTIKQGQRSITPLVFVWVKSSDNSHTRLSCVVSKKVSKLAVKRHRIQRQLREAAKMVLQDLNQLDKTYNIVIVARPVSINSKNLVAEVGAQLQDVISSLSSL